MVRDDILRFYLEYVRDEHSRTEARVALLETKLALTAAFVGLMLTLVATLWHDISHSDLRDWLVLTFGIASLCVAGAAAIVGSLLSWVSSPMSSEQIADDCQRVLEELGVQDSPVDPQKAETLWTDISRSYRDATVEKIALVKDRANKLHIAQVALMFACLMLFMYFGLPWIGNICALVIRGDVNG